jgi:chemotaxis protein methyltransferase CheR
MDQPLTDDLYARFRDLLNSRSGLSYPPPKRQDLSHGLHLALRTCGMVSLDELYDAAAAGGAAWGALLAQLTIGETYFFRNAPQFHALRHSILPEVIARRTVLQSLRVWSAGCATGEEPYWLAMLLDELIPDNQPWHVSILATDINPHCREQVGRSWPRWSHS